MNALAKTDANRAYVDSIFGKLYVYADENGDAIAVARNSRGPNGGWTGESIAQLSVPDKKKTRSDLNRYANLFAASEDMLEVLVEARTQVEILQARLGIKDNGNGTLSIIDAALSKATASRSSDALRTIAAGEQS